MMASDHTKERLMDQSFTYFHTSDMSWEDDPAIPGFKRRLLNVNPVTGGHIKQWYLPPAYGPAVGTLPHRHYHRTVTERAYHLAGDFPHWEFQTGADMDGELVVFKRHIFMDRPPLSIHGRFPDPSSQTGSEILYWNNGVGTGLGEPEAVTETITVEFDETGRDDPTLFTDASVFLTLERPWLDHPSIESWKFKSLAGPSPGNAPVGMVNIPPNGTGPSGVQIAGNDEPRWLYVVSGDVKLRMTGTSGPTDLALIEGGYVSWDANASLGFSNGTISEGGATVICIGHDLAEADSNK
jgi:hypothetical protein